jgi:hypothetical protein
MLELDKDSVRRFKVIGFEQFERVLAGESLWMEVFRESIVDINFDSADPNDYRAIQLKSLASATANILLCLATTEDQDLVSPGIVEKANKFSAFATKSSATSIVVQAVNPPSLTP